MTAKTETPVRPAGGPEAAALTWTSAILGGEITVERGLREGGSPWLIRARGTSAVLRVAPLESRERLATEVAALRHAAGAGLPVPEVLGHDDGTASGFALAAGIGSPGIDLGSVRLDAALCYGQDAVTEVQSGWQDEAGRAAPDVPYWDAVAALATPPDMAWVAPTIADQGRPDLTGDLLAERRETFLQAALSRMD